MLYRKIRVSQLDDTKKLYRVMWVKEDMDLYQLAHIIMAAFCADENVLCRFVKSGTVYVSPDEEAHFKDVKMQGCPIEEPGNSYRFIYDPFEDWEFEVRIQAEIKEIDSECMAIIEEGKGQGIWQNNRAGYLRLLGGEFPDDPDEIEENGLFLPWNLDLETASETFEDIDPQEETERIAAEAFAYTENKNSIWSSFNRVVRQAEDSFMYESSDGSLWLEAWEEFRKVCIQLKEQGELPETYELLEYRYDDYETAGFPESLADELPDYGMYTELWQIMDELENMFGPDGSTEFEIIRGKAEALKGLKRKKDLLVFAEEKLEQYPDNYFVKSVLLNAYRFAGKKEEGKRYMESVLENEPECDEDNYPLYYAAKEFASHYGMKELAKRLEESIEAEDRRQLDELEAEFGGFDDEMDDFDVMLWETFNDLVSRAEDPDLSDEKTAQIRLRAFDEFIRVCEELEEEGELPVSLAALDETYAGLEVDDFIIDLNFNLSYAGLYQELWDCMEKLEQMFEPDGDTEFEIIRSKASALAGMGRNQELMDYCKEAFRNHPANDVCRSVMIDALRINKKKKDGLELVTKFLEEEPECGTKNYNSWMAALRFAEYAGKKKLAERLRDSLEELKTRLSEEMDEDDGELLEELAERAEDYHDDPNDETFMQAAAVFINILAADEYVWIAMVDTAGSNRPQTMAVSTGEDVFLAVFTDDDESRIRNGYFAEIPLRFLIDAVIEKGTDGICINPDLKNEVMLVFPREMLEYLMNPDADDFDGSGTMFDA